MEGGSGESKVDEVDGVRQEAHSRDKATDVDNALTV